MIFDLIFQNTTHRWKQATSTYLVSLASMAVSSFVLSSVFHLRVVVCRSCKSSPTSSCVVLRDGIEGFDPTKLAILT